MIARPKPTEYAPFYQGYIDQVGNEHVMDFLKKQTEMFPAFLKTLSQVDLSYRYAENKWSIAEVLGHLIDVERVMAYRALRIGRGDQTELPGFDQDLYVENGRYDSFDLDTYIEEFGALRKSNMLMLHALSEQESMRIGKASGSNCSVRALIYIMAGHVSHHLQILNERYM